MCWVGCKIWVYVSYAVVQKGASLRQLLVAGLGFCSSPCIVHEVASNTRNIDSLLMAWMRSSGLLTFFFRCLLKQIRCLMWDLKQKFAPFLAKEFWKIPKLIPTM